MSKELWTNVDDYLEQLFIEDDKALRSAQDRSREEGLPSISVSPVQGKFLMLLVGLVGAERVLEIGTLGGYSTIWMARALPPSGKMITLESSPHHARVAAANIDAAGLSERVEIKVGRAVETLAIMAGEGAGPFDLIFIDADKPGYADYLDWSLKLSRPGTLIVADNVVRNGAVAEVDSADENVRGVREFNKLLSETDGIDATVLQTVGAKGYDGMAFAVVR
ncbi:MAG: O-methyltransferase [Cyanobacteria bacterium HKST-UBA02]|nr:O-methyltransferase [Cyanobacteria bacterium HKST-UBA02]